MGVILIYTTVETTTQAENIAKKLIEEGIVACANMWPIHSMYTFNNAFTKGQEIALLLKTCSEQHEVVYEKLIKLHPYKCPAIMTLPINHAHRPFLDWVNEQAHAST